MRPGRISLIAIMAILAASGCSASRSTILPDDGGDAQPEVPPRHDTDYSPDPWESDEASPGTVPPVPSGEPLPAPPATGVSRVKSVSWLKDLGSKIQGKPVPCGSECGDNDELLIGRCSPIEPCVPGTECASRGCVERYRESVCDGQNTDRLNPARSLGKSITKLFHKGAPAQCSQECAEYLIPQRRCTPAFDDSCAASPGPRNARRELHPGKKSGCLADPLAEPFTDDTDPGLITPEERERPTEPEIPPDVPAPQQVPGVPTISPSELQSPPVPELPGVPVPSTSSTQVVEPPAWPRLMGVHSVYQVSQPAAFSPPAQPHSVSAVQLPLVVPKARR